MCGWDELNDEKFPALILSKDEILVQKNVISFAWEEDRMMSAGSNFLYGRPHGATPHLHMST